MEVTQKEERAGETHGKRPTDLWGVWEGEQQHERGKTTFGSEYAMHISAMGNTLQKRQRETAGRLREIHWEESCKTILMGL